jgi:long-chain fatty acid transport protein
MKTRIGLLSVALLWPVCASASGLDAPGIGSLFSGPLSADAASVYHNPAMLGLLRRPSILLGAGLVTGRVGFERERRANYQRADLLNFAEPLPPNAYDPSKTGRAEEAVATPFAATGDVFGLYPLGPGRPTLGFGLYAPYAAQVDYAHSDAIRSQVESATLSAGYVTAAVGWRVHEALSLGAGVSSVLGVAALSKRQDFGALDDFGDALERPPISQPNDFGADAPPAVRELDTLARPVRIDDAFAYGFTFNGGIVVQPRNDVAVALTYHHGVVLDYEGDFRLDLNDDFFTGDLGYVGLDYPPIVTGDATVTLALPRRVCAAVAYAPSPALWLEARFAWVGWSSVDALRVELRSPGLAQPKLGLPPVSRVSEPRRWNDAPRAEVTARYVLERDWSVAGLLGWDAPASPDATIDASSPDGHRLTAGAGVSRALGPDLQLLGDLRVQKQIPREVRHSDFDRGNGRYDLLLAQLGVHLQIRFGGAR